MASKTAKRHPGKSSGPLQRRHDRAAAAESAAPAASAWQVRNGFVAPCDWVDPADLNPGRRTARRIEGVRAADVICRLKQAGTINSLQAAAAARLRASFEKGIAHARIADWSSAGSGGFAPGAGPAERTLQALEAYQAAQRHVGRLFPLLFAVCIEGETLRDAAARLAIAPIAASARLWSSLESLCDHYEQADGPAKERATIMPQAMRDAAD